MKIKFLKDFIAAQSDDYSDMHAIFIERGDIVDVDGCKYNGRYFDMPKAQAQWLIDNGFAEEVKEPTWVRKQIERVDITAGYKYTDVQYRFIKSFYYDDTELGVGAYAKNDTSYQRFYMYDKPDELGYLDKVALINQLVRDGYIEIQDNPNIVWEDDNEQDRTRTTIGNVFKTKTAAERYRDYLKAVATVRQDEGVLTPDDARKTLARDGTVYTVGINGTMLSVEHFYNTSAGAVYFDTGYNAKTSCEKHQDEWMTIANYDWSRE